MRNLLALLAVLTLTIGGVGLWRNWFTIHSAPGGTEGESDITIHVNTQKMGKDLHEGKEKVHELLEKATDDSDRAETAKTEKASKEDPKKHAEAGKTGPIKKDDSKKHTEAAKAGQADNQAGN